MLGTRATTVIVGLVSTIWAINFIAGIVLPEYDADQAINGIFMAIVGGTLALGSRKPPPPKDGKDGGEQP